MTDPKISIQRFAAKEEAGAGAWFGTNWVPFAVGLLVGILFMVAVRAL